MPFVMLGDMIGAEVVKMGAFIGLLGLFGFFVCLILLLVALIRKKPKKKIAIALAVCFALFVVGLAITPTSEPSEWDEPDSSQSERVSDEENLPDKSDELENEVKEEPGELSEQIQDSSEPALQDLTRDDILSQKTSATYKDLLRTPDEYAGEYVVVTAQINQIMEEGLFETTTYYFGRTDESGYEFYFDDEYCFTDKRLDDDTKLLEEDILVVYGRFTELKKFSRALTGADIEIPVVEMLYVEILDENSAENTVIDTSGMTVEQQNAVKKADSYLSHSAFSYGGLIEQLEYEEFPHDIAVYAADNCGADWNEQALLSAQSYLSHSAFSYSGLIDQLIYEEFTEEEAKYAVDNCGADWNEQAAKKAESYLSHSAFSRDRLISQLEYEGFTYEQAVYGAEQNGY